MCGRYTHLYTWKQLHRLMTLTTIPAGELAPRYNLAPTQKAPVVRQDPEGARSADLLRWGLVPFWADDPTIGSKMINARAETAADKPAFRAAFKSRRCIVPASGFYEWKALEGQKAKQPYYIRPAEDGGIFAIAGLWERWKTKDGADAVETFTILTTEPNDLMKTLHDRMPVILDPADFDRWLDPKNADAASLNALMRPAHAETMMCHPVSTRVNTPKNDEPSLVETL